MKMFKNPDEAQEYRENGAVCVMENGHISEGDVCTSCPLNNSNACIFPLRGYAPELVDVPNLDVSR